VRCLRYGSTAIDQEQTFFGSVFLVGLDVKVGKLRRSRGSGTGNLVSLSECTHILFACFALPCPFFPLPRNSFPLCVALTRRGRQQGQRQWQCRERKVGKQLTFFSKYLLIKFSVPIGEQQITMQRKL